MRPYFLVEWFGETDDFEGWNDCGVDGEQYTLEEAQAVFEKECTLRPQYLHRMVMVLDQSPVEGT